METLPAGSVITIFSSLVVGIIFGFVLQRGRFCMNTCFRDVMWIQEVSLFRAYLLALAITMIGANLLEDMGLIFGFDEESGELVATELSRQTFAPVANILGGYLFGLGIVLAGGCGSGILFRIGEGVFAAIVAVFGFFIGISATMHGWLKPVYEFLRGIKLEINGKVNPSLWDIFGGSQEIKWIIICIICAVFIIYVLKGKPFGKAPGKGFYWSTVGVLTGIVAILAWWASGYFGGDPRGLSFTGPTKEFFLSLLTGNSMSPRAQFDFFGVFTSTWSAFYVAGVPIGAYISAKLLKEFKWKVPPINDLLTSLFGGFIMGIGAAIGGGCNVGHGLTGASTGAISSFVATIFIILGNWTMVYFKFIKPMKDI